MKRLAVILAFTRQDLIDRYSGSVLGGFWLLLMPLVNILIFTLVFSKIMGARLVMAGMPAGDFNYSLYLVSGLLAWNCFASSVTRITNVYQDKAGIIGKVNVSLPLLPLYVLLSESVIYLISMTFFLLFIFWVDHPLDRSMLALPLVFLLQSIIAYSLGLLFATLAVFIRDIRELVGIIFTVWFWLTPIVYVANILPDGWGESLSYNPAVFFIDAYRDIILLNRLPDGLFFLGAAMTAGGVFIFARYVHRRLQQDIRDFI